MRNYRLRFLWKIFFRWLWLAVRLKPLRLTDLDTDQRLLFAGSSCRLIWNIQGAYLVQVYLDGKKIGSYLSEECPVIQVKASCELEVKAFGLYRHIRKSLTLIVRKLAYRDTEMATLRKTEFFQPPVVQDFLLRLSDLQPATPQPVIHVEEILLDTPYRKQLETELQERITQYQLTAEKPKSYFDGN